MNRKPVKANSPGARIRTLRIANGLSQAALAKKIGVTQGAVSQIELGDTSALKHSTIAGLVDALHTTARYIMRGEEGAHAADMRETVTLDERELLHYWRSLDRPTQLTVMRMVRGAVAEFKPSVANPFPNSKDRLAKADRKLHQ